MILDSTFTALLAKATYYPRWLVWFKVKNPSNNATVRVGIWNDLGDMPVTIDGETRVYVGAGSLLSIPAFTYEKGLNVQSQTLTLSTLSPEIVALLRGYTIKFGEVEVHLALLDPETGQIAATSRAFKGFLDGVDIVEDEGSATANLTLVSSMRSGTRILAGKQSDASQRLRDPSDTGRIYADTSDNVKVEWGSYSGQINTVSVRNINGAMNKRLNG